MNDELISEITSRYVAEYSARMVGRNADTSFVGKLIHEAVFEYAFSTERDRRAAVIEEVKELVKANKTLFPDTIATLKLLENLK